MEPMTAEQALKFAYDWPLIPGLALFCNTCGAYVPDPKALRHLDARHPGWLERWNNAITGTSHDQHNR